MGVIVTEKKVNGLSIESSSQRMSNVKKYSMTELFLKRYFNKDDSPDATADTKLGRGNWQKGNMLIFHNFKLRQV